MAAEHNINQAAPVEINELLALIVENSDDAIIGKDLNGIITSWNRAAERIFGYTAQEAIGQSILMIIPEERREEETGILERVKRGERIDHFETVRRAKDGRLIQASLTISPIKNRDGRIVGCSKISRDVTEARLAQQKLEQANKKYARDLEKKVEERTASLQAALTELETFSYSVSHDLRAPLRAMEQYARVLMEDYGDKLDDNARRYLQRIIASGGKLDALIRDLLSYSRVIRSQVELRPMELEPLISDVLTENPLLQPPRTEVRMESPLAPVLGNEVFLSQCLANLLGNTAKFVPAGVDPRIRIRTEKRGHIVRVWIEDNGIGIAPEFHARVFSMFERLNAGTTYEGTGIGLAIVRKAMERMGGAVGVESEVGKGSRFWFELPEAAHAEKGRGKLF